MQHRGASFLHTIPKAFLDEAVMLHFSAGEYIKRAGDSFDHFCILNKGSCKLVYESENTSLIIDLYHKGDFFGEMEAIGMQTTDRSLIAGIEKIVAFGDNFFNLDSAHTRSFAFGVFTVPVGAGLGIRAVENKHDNTADKRQKTP